MIRFILAVILSLAAAPAHAQTIEAALTPGWDDVSLPLSSGRVSWSAGPASGGQLNVRVVFEVRSAAPNRRFGAGVHFFEASGSKMPEVTQFGGKRMGGGRQTLSREGRSATIVGAFDFGVLTTDARGNGRAEFLYTVPNRLYLAQFTVRRGANCSAQSADCACVYRTGIRFGRDFERIGSGGASPVDLNGSWSGGLLHIWQDGTQVLATATWKRDGKYCIFRAIGQLNGRVVNLEIRYSPMTHGDVAEWRGTFTVSEDSNTIQALYTLGAQTDRRTYVRDR